MANLLTRLVHEVKRRERIAKYRGKVSAGSKYNPNDKDIEVVGVKSPVLWWATAAGYDNSTDQTGAAVMSIDIFDTTSRTDSARIRLVNSNAVTQYLAGISIKGLPVMRYSGELGLRHDDFVDYDDIYSNGETLYEFGNNYIVSTGQLGQLADYWWKFLRVARHIYTITIPGAYYWVEPGEWYYLEIGDVGEREYIRSTVECYEVAVEAGANMDSSTTISFREVYQNWVKDSGAIARYLATGDPRQNPINYSRLVVAAPEYMGVADYYCETTSAQTVIQTAIDRMAGIGGGIVELTEGQFNTTATIELNQDNVILEGHGFNTVIMKNCNDYAIESVGGSGTEISGIQLRNLKVTKHTDDNNAKDLIYIKYSDNVIIQGVWADNSIVVGFRLVYCDNSLLTANVATNNDSIGIFIDGDVLTPTQVKIIGNTATSNGTYGIGMADIVHSVISNNICDANGDHGIAVIMSNYNSVTGNITRGNGTVEGDSGGIYLSVSDHNVISGNIATDNISDGILIHASTCDKNVVTGNRATANTVANFHNHGTGTVDSGNEWT